MIKNIPFYPNTKDNTHCYQACTKMVLKGICPEKNFSYKKLEKLFNKPKNKYSWAPSAVVNLKKIGIDAKIISTFDYKKFTKDGFGYLRSNYPKDVAEDQIKMSNIEAEMKNAKIMLKHKLYRKEKLTLKDIENLFRGGWFIIAAINPFVLDNEKGYAGHGVLIIGFDKKYVYLHDPGLPAKPSRKVKKAIFMKAFRYPKNESDVFIIRNKRSKL
jgi:hypothetical protein